MLIIDEGSLAPREALEKLSNQLRELMSSPTRPRGGISVLFARDFSQLLPAQNKWPLFVREDFQPWCEWVICFLELRSNHCFSEDPEWGEILQCCRGEGPNCQDASVINVRVIGSAVGPKESKIPDDVTRAVKTNLDCNAVNDAVFVQRLQKTHSIDSSVPQHHNTLSSSKPANKSGKRKKQGKSASISTPVPRICSMPAAATLTSINVKQMERTADLKGCN